MAAVLAGAAWGQAPNYTPDGIVNASDYSSGPFAPNSVLTIFGTNLSWDTRQLGASDIVDDTLPTTLASVAVYVDNYQAPLIYVSPTQINLQVPWQTAVGSSATLVVNNNGQLATQTFNVAAASPGIFTNPNKVIVPNGTAAQGQTTTLYMAGTGAVTPAIATGAAPLTSTPLSDLPAPANTTVTVDGVQAATTFIGIPYDLVGVTQINFTIPSNVPTGFQPVVVSVNGTPSAVAYVNVTN